MVFCYKIITESPRRSSYVSPRRKSPTTGSLRNVTSPLTQLGTIEYEGNSTDLLDSIPEREWRLLAALAKRREEDDKRENLANQFRLMWQKEKEERETVERETNRQYRRYITRKRHEEQNWNDYKQLQKTLEQQTKRQQLVNCIKSKEQKSAEVLAWIDDYKVNTLIDKALEDEARAVLAAERRSRIDDAQEMRRRAQLEDAEKKAVDAGRRKRAFLRDASQRVAISHALSTWETSMTRQELSAMESARRAQYIANVALTDARITTLRRATDYRKRRARQLAALTQQLRDFIRSGPKL